MIHPNEFGEKFSEKINKMTTKQRVAYLKELGFTINTKSFISPLSRNDMKGRYIIMPKNGVRKKSSKPK